MYHLTKRILDIIISLTSLIILSPVFLILMLVLACTGEHCIFFKQKRIGKNSQPFYIWKFATMLKNSPNLGTKEITLRNDPRVTRVGKFLRITKLNELPQLFNVIAGEMSIVGPRPLMEVSYNLYPKDLAKKVYTSIPGITGVGSIIYRDEEKIVTASRNPQATYQSLIRHKASLEIWYQNNASLWTDLKIIFVTAFAIFTPVDHLVKKYFPGLPSKEEPMGESTLKTIQEESGIKATFQ